MALNSLTLTRVHQMSHATDTRLTEQHMNVLEYAWRHYRSHSIGPLYQNIKRNTGITKSELGSMFPNGLNSVFTWVGIPIQTKDHGCKAMVSLEIENPQEVYFDHNATTPLRAEVSRSMIRFLEDPRSYGNPSSAYDIGTIAFDAVDQARSKLASSLSVNPEEIFFVGSGTEANNLALCGITGAGHGNSGHIITTCVEHPSVLQTAHSLEAHGYEVTYLPVMPDGTLSPDSVKQSLRKNTVAVSIMAANNEIGTIYPIGKIGEICREHGVPLIVDAIQGFGKIPLTPRQMGISALTMSGHKIGAPKGVGAIFVDESMRLAPQIVGGGQEGGLRAGTENVLGIHAMGLAAELAVNEIEVQTRHLLTLREYFLDQLDRIVPEARVNGTLEHRLANNLSIGFPGIDSGSLLLSLNQIGVYVSAGSACSAGKDSHSHVLDAIGVDASQYGTVRFGFGMSTTTEDIDYLFKHLPAILRGLDS